MRRFLTSVVGATLGFVLAAAPIYAATDQPQDQAGALDQPDRTTAEGLSGDIPDGTIGKAGAALHDVAELQERYQGKIESASPEQKQILNKQAEAEAIEAIQARGLSVREYSRVVQTAQTNPQVKQRLMSAAASGDP